MPCDEDLAMLRKTVVQVSVVLIFGLGIGWFVGASRMHAGQTEVEATDGVRHAGGSELCRPGSPIQDCCLPGLNRAGLMK